MKIGAASLLIIAIMGVTVLAQSPPTLRIVTETPGLPSELFYGNTKVKPLRLRPGTNQVITIDDIDLFVYVQYTDFLFRNPDGTGFANWVATLTGCPNGGFGEFDNPHCDRVHVSAGFYRSHEFLGRGYWVYRAYDAVLARRALYAEFVPDLNRIGGPKSPQEEEAAKVVYMNDFVNKAEFLTKYPTSQSPTTFVNALETSAGVTLPNKADLISGLTGGTLTRAQVTRNVIEQQAVFDKFFNRGFVTMQYFGYLRRNPDTIGFANWVATLEADPQNFRHMIFGFIYSDEYRARF